MRRVFVALLIHLTITAPAQHCPWDCSGMILLKTNVSAAEFKKQKPVLVDADKNVIADTVYGTGLETYDTCRFMFYKDFKSYRTERTKIHYWYRYDTLYRFAEEYAVVRFNFCRFKMPEGRLYIRVENTMDTARPYSYVEVPPGKRIHLHDYSRMINEKAHQSIRDSIQPFVLDLSRRQWGLPE